MQTAQTQVSDYEQQAIDFLESTGTTLDVVFLYTGPYFDDKESRDVYQFTLKNKRGIYSAKFGDSIHNSEIRAFVMNEHNQWDIERNPKARKLGIKNRSDFSKARRAKPSAYDILACLDTYDGSFKDFCNEFGYDTDSRKAEKVYFAVQEQTDGLRRIFTPEQLEQLQEIN